MGGIFSDENKLEESVIRVKMQDEKYIEIIDSTVKE